MTLGDLKQLIADADRLGIPSDRNVVLADDDSEYTLTGKIYTDQGTRRRIEFHSKLIPAREVEA